MSPGDKTSLVPSPSPSLSQLHIFLQVPSHCLQRDAVDSFPLRRSAQAFGSLGCPGSLPSVCICGCLFLIPLSSPAPYMKSFLVLSLLPFFFFLTVASSDHKADALKLSCHWITLRHFSFSKTKLISMQKPHLCVKPWCTCSCSVLEEMIFESTPERLAGEGRCCEKRPRRGGIKSSE